MIRHRSEEGIIASSGRLDAAASASLGIPRSVFSLPSAVIRLNGVVARKSAKAREGDRVSVEYDEEVFEGIEAEDLPLDVLFEDSSLLVINKAQGMAVHPGAGLVSGTVANALVSRYGADFPSSDTERPGIVHRLDKDTSGVMVIAKTLEALEALQKQFSSHTTEKHYSAIVKGVMPFMHGMIDFPIERDPKDRRRFRAASDQERGKSALTEYTVLRILNGYSLLDVRIHTGRTHQIRVHMKASGHPILGDPIYGVHDPRYPEATLMLHASSLSFDHPLSGERLHFSAPLPSRFDDVLSLLT